MSSTPKKKPAAKPKTKTVKRGAPKMGRATKKTARKTSKKA